MIFNIDVNNKQIKARKGETILSALNRNGINVPTLCYMPKLSPTGACRMCVVEIEGKPDLIPSCSHQVEEWMKISTHSPRVIKARKTLVELLLANHPDDCLYCVRNNNCELQRLATEHNVRERRYHGSKNKLKLDQSCPAIVRDPSKCVFCGRCVRVCSEIIGVSTFEFTHRGIDTAVGTTYGKPLNLSNCITCGQCVMECPTGALHEKESFSLLQEALYNKDLYPVIQCSPTVSLAIAEEFGIKAGKDFQGLLFSGLRKIGFRKVYDTGMGIDINTINVANELAERIKNNDKLPLFTSCCPAWIKYAEQYYPDLLPHLSKQRSPQQLLGRMIKQHLANTMSLKPDKIFSVAVMPCTSKKFEAQREEMIFNNSSDVDLVLTTRELAKLFRLNGIDLTNGEAEHADAPFAIKSSASRLYGTSGGVAETIIRTLHHQLTGQDLSQNKISKLRGIKPRKDLKVQLGEHEIGIVAVSTMVQLEQLMREINSGKTACHLIEVMACPGGCVNGGGQPFTRDENVVPSRVKTIYDADEKESVKSAHKNPALNETILQLLKQLDQASEGGKFIANFEKRTVLL
jgi:NADH-quinone oxidoreductase subunit G/NADP-reducing hydrogenase subunit HndD